MNYKIRPIEKSDNEAIKGIIFLVSEEYGTYDPNSKQGAGAGAGDLEIEDLYNAYNNSYSKYWVIVEENSNKIIGGGGFSKLKNSNDIDQICEMQKVFLLKEYRGKGLGRELVSLIVDSAKKYGYKVMYLESVKQMKEARSLYQKLGFTDLKNELGNTGHFQCNVFMSKKL